MSYRLSLTSATAVIAVLACRPDNPLQPDGSGIEAALGRSASASYDAIDLGTLGAQSVTPRMMIDKKGRVYALGIDSDSRVHVLRWEDGTVSDLGIVPGREVTFSPRGLAAGSSCTPTPDGCGPVSFFQFDEGTLTPLETGGVAFVGSGVMDLLDHNSTVLATVRYSDRQAGVIWRDGVRQELSPLDQVNTSTIPVALNKDGQVIAQSFALDFSSFRPSVLDNGALRDLGTLTDASCGPNPSPGCAYATPGDINDRGDIVGLSINASGINRAVIWPGGGQIQELNVLPGETTQGALINNRGQVIVYGPDGFYVWDNGNVQRAGTLGGSFALVKQWTDDGTAIGWSLTADGGRHAFVWHDGQMTDLGAGPAGGQSGEAASINDRGEILGSYYDANFQQRLILWRPVVMQP
jgi:probable HAF family extracellular repeat protein